ncbi:hypothetical protein DYB25_000871 [Aphanomyces astaci]|uniref:CW-type domain-containing protein n=1 Tax=Aphanomyces astaci TaxID=112090 RepID=A0A397AT52_APHAT|nr:hypothetical protein DYB36_001893 [Aphanomyces astaci]RHY14781.1 hypothetical protein DYB25_000871 [Aphanomyces astaci]
MHEVDETAALRTADMSPLDRLKYVTSLWPTNMPNFPDTEDSLNYYGFQVGIYIDTNDETKDETNPASTHNQDETTKAADPNENDHDTIDTPLDDAHQPEANSSKQPLMKAAPAAPVKEENWVHIRERKFVHQFAQRLKRMEKALGELKYADMKEDLGGRQHVSCVECGKKRPLLGGMDPIKVPQPFVCWMNRWDEIHASCSAPQGVLFERGTTDTPAATAAAAASGGAAAVDKKSLKQPRRTSHARSNHRSTKPKKKAATAEPLDVAAPPPPLYSSTSEEEIAPKKPRRDDMASTTRKK